MSTETEMLDAALEKMCGGSRLAQRRNFAGKTRLEYLRERIAVDRVTFVWGFSQERSYEMMYFSHLVGEDPEMDRFCEVHDDHSDDTKMWSSQYGPVACTDEVMYELLSVEEDPARGDAFFVRSRP